MGESGGKAEIRTTLSTGAPHPPPLRGGPPSPWGKVILFCKAPFFFTFLLYHRPLRRKILEQTFLRHNVFQYHFAVDIGG